MLLLVKMYVKQTFGKIRLMMAANSKYDCIYIGSGIISLIDACYKSSCGQKVIVIERDSKIGGVWGHLKLPGKKIKCDHGVHYLLDDDRASDFFLNKLNCDLEEVQGQYEVTFETNGNLKLSRREKKGFYFRNGSFSLLNSVKQLINEQNISFKLNTTVDKIELDHTSSPVLVTTNDTIFSASKVIYTSGTSIPEISINGQNWSFDIADQIRIRPQLYLQFKNSGISKIKQALFKDHPTIKYIHNISDYSVGLESGSSLFIVAFKSMGDKSELIVEREMKKLGMINKDAEISYAHAICPILSCYSKTNLDELSKNSIGKIEAMYTENFAAAVGHCSETWTDSALF